MAFDAKALSSTLSAGRRVHVYETADTGATVIAAGYFNAARDQSLIKVNEVCHIVCGIGGSLQHNTVVFSAVPATGNVTIAQGTTIT